jgi:hypothetical protein
LGRRKPAAFPAGSNPSFRRGCQTFAAVRLVRGAVFRGESSAPICFLEAPPCQPSHARRPLTAGAPCCLHAAAPRGGRCAALSTASARGASHARHAALHVVAAIVAAPGGAARQTMESPWSAPAPRVAQAQSTFRASDHSLAPHCTAIKLAAPGIIST